MDASTSPRMTHDAATGLRVASVAHGASTGLPALWLRSRSPDPSQRDTVTFVQMKDGRPEGDQVIRPSVRPEMTWIVDMHGLFQMKYDAHHVCREPDGHRVYKSPRWYDACCRFCECDDPAAFDPRDPTQPLAHFAPMLREVLGRKPFDPVHMQAA